MDLLPTEVAPASWEGHSSRADKRKARNQLPRVMFILNRRLKLLLCAVLLAECCYVESDPNTLYWRCDRVVRFQSPYSLEASDFSWVSTVIYLTKSVELAARQAFCEMGGSMNDHFHDVPGQTRWYAWPADDALLQQCSQSGGPFTFCSAAKMAKALGIVASIAREVPNAARDVIREGEALSSAATDVADGDFVVHVAGAAGSAAMHVIQRLKEMRQTHRGAIEHKWTVKGLLDCLRFAESLRPGVPVSRAVADAVRFLFGESAYDVADMIDKKELPVPGLDSMRRARLRLDMATMYYERSLLKDFFYIRFLSIDASPQLGRNFLCVREDRIKFPRSKLYDYDWIAKFDLNNGFESRILPVSTIGHGKANAIAKAVNTASLLMLESSDEASFHEARSSVLGVTTDQGAERNICDLSVRVLPGFETAGNVEKFDIFLFPKALSVLGHLHLLWNALEEACKSLEISDGFFNEVRVYCNFLSDVGLRRKLQHACMHGHPQRKMFNHFPRTHVDWRWEFLSDALGILMPLLPVLASVFSLNAMLGTCSGSPSSSIELRNVAAALKNLDMFMIFAEMMLTLALVIQKYSSCLEGCWCHRHIWMRKRTHSARTADLKKETGFERCVWKGRQSPWWVAVGIQRMMQDLRQAKSHALDAKIAALPKDLIVCATHIWNKLQQNLIEILTDKLQMWSHIPWKLCGVFACCCGVDIEISKRILQECISEYEEAVRKHTDSKLHRVAVRLLNPEGTCGRQLREWLVADSPLTNFTTAYCLLCFISLISLVERSVESIHARLKWIGKTCTYLLPPYVCCRVRERDNMALLRSNPDFYRLCLEIWRRPDFYDALLRMRVAPGRLKTMSPRDKLHAIYQCDFNSEFADTTRAIEDMKLLTSTVSSLSNLPSGISYAMKQCLYYLRFLFHSHQCFSLPIDVYDAWVAAGCDVEAPVEDQICDYLSTVLAACSGDMREVDLDDTSTESQLKYFHVINADPNKRNHMRIPHMTQSSFIIVVEEAVFLGKSAANRCVALKPSDRQHRLDLVWILADIASFLPSLFCWELSRRNATLVPRGVPASKPLAIADCEYDLPLDVALPREDINSALVPLEPDVDEVAVRRSVLALSHAQALHKPVPASTISAASLARLRERSVVHVSIDESGRDVVMFAREAVTSCPFSNWTNPVQAFRCASDEPVLKLPKLYHAIRLQEDGWQPAFGRLQDVVCDDDGADLRYKAEITKPASYFAALSSRAQIFQKGVPSISHNMTDGYYRCLILASAAKLQHVLANMAGKDDAWFVESLKSATSANVLAIEDMPGDQADVDALSAITDGIAPYMLPEDTLGGDWCRCIAALTPDGPAHKIWFDNCSSASGKKRGFTNCAVHGCIKYKHTEGSFREFLTAMCLWHAHCDGRELTREQHLQYWPSADEVQTSVGVISFHHF